LSPVYKKDLPHRTVEDRRQNLNGFVQGVFQLDSMVEAILSPLRVSLDMYIFAAESGPTELPTHVQSSSLWPSPAKPKPLAALLARSHWVSKMRVADLSWNLVAVPVTMGNRANDLMGWLLLAAGLLVTGIVVAFMWSSARDEQKLIHANLKVSELAQTDALTGLANRRAFMDMLGISFAASKREAVRFALHYIDLDHFKDVNDTLGHPIGDLLLHEAAERLKGTVRGCDLVARFGGDEFAVLQTDATDLEGSGSLAAKIVARLAEPYAISGNEVCVTASIGIAHCAAGACGG
jgi:diguanylate cyclase (GGDEF)-like protein